MYLQISELLKNTKERIVYEKNTNLSIMGTMKKIMPVILILSLVWIVIIVGWYLIGLPIGINTNITL